MKSSRSTLRSFALLLVLTGVLFRGLIPAGFMPGTFAATNGGDALLVLCSGGSLKALPGKAGEGPGAPAQHAMEQCGFAATASPGLPPAPFALSLTHETGTVRPAFVVIANLANANRTRPPARGPPLTA